LQSAAEKQEKRGELSIALLVLLSELEEGNWEMVMFWSDSRFVN
jgi:hypothetical protein